MGNTYKYLETVMQNFFLNPARAQRFKMEFEEQMATDSEEEKPFPYVFAAFGGTVENEGVTEFTVDLYCWDLLNEGRTNTVDIISDTHQILRDFYKWLENDGDPYIIVPPMPNIDPLNNGLLDVAAGNVIRGLTFELPSSDPCEIPTAEEE